MRAYFRISNMTSCEPKRCSAYSDDLRWRIVWQRVGLDCTYEAVARNLCVDKSTVKRIVDRFEQSGNVSKQPYPKERAARKLILPAQLLILQLVMDQPAQYLDEIQKELRRLLLIDVDISTICRFLQKCGFTRQKLRIVAMQQDQLLRQQFICDISAYNTDMFIFIDETGADNRNALRKYGYSLRGKTPVSHALLVRGVRVSAIACMSIAGLLDVKTITGTSDGDAFYDFVHSHLLPHLMPFNGTNPHSVVILDNCSIHHVPEVAQSIQDVGALLLYLPPYSPDLNPIEELFSKVKKIMKSPGIEVYETDIENSLLASFASVTQEDCSGWIHHTGIYT